MQVPLGENSEKLLFAEEKKSCRLGPELATVQMWKLQVFQLVVAL